MTQIELADDSVFGIPAPRKIGICGRQRAFDTGATHPGLGVTVGYRAPGVELTLHVYDLGLEDIQDGALSEHCKRHYLQCITDVFDAGKAQGLQVTLLGRQLRSTDASGPEFLRAAFVLEGRDQGPRLSVLLLTCHAGRFVRLRASSSLAPDAAHRAIEEAADAYSALLWPHRSATRTTPINRQDPA